MNLLQFLSLFLGEQQGQSLKTVAASSGCQRDVSPLPVKTTEMNHPPATAFPTEPLQTVMCISKFSLSLTHEVKLTVPL